MDWHKKEISSQEIREMAEKTGMDLLQASILLRRGFSINDSCYFLEEDFRYLHNPFLFRHMADVVDRIHLAAEEQEHVLICGDRDVDGISSTVLLYQALKEAGVEARWKVPTGDEAYGLNSRVIRDFASRDGSLLFCVDCGISNYEEIKLAGDLGIDVIILDHHNPRGNQLPEALYIINPKIAQDAYPFEGLAGCGVVSKLIWALCFAKTGLYKQGVCFLYADGEKGRLEIYKYVNLLETRRMSYPLDKAIPVEGLAEDLQGWPLFAYGLEEQNPLFSKAFGNTADLHVQDLAREICRDSPSLKGLSFSSLRDKSRLARYRKGKVDNSEAFLHLFSALMLTSEKEAFCIYEESLDLVALGTMADLMPLIDENRILVNRGMNLLSRVKRPGLRELFIRQHLLGKPLETRDLSWSVSPWINSSGRMGQADKAVELFLSDNEKTRGELADYLHDLNQERKKLGDTLWDRAYKEAQESLEEHRGKMTLVRQEDIPRGMAGIVASRMNKAFSLPALILSRQPDGSLSGSLRSPRGCSIQPFLKDHGDLFTDFGGHDCAGGFTMEGKNEEIFLKRLKLYCDKWNPQVNKDIPRVDALIPAEYIKPELWDMVGRLEPYGEGFPGLVFFSRNLLIEKTELVGKGKQDHLKFILASDYSKFQALYWNGAEEFSDFMNPGNRINLLYNVSKNYYMNRETLQIIIIGMEPSN